MLTKNLDAKTWYFTRCFTLPIFDLTDGQLPGTVSIRSRFLRSAFYKVTGRGPSRTLTVLSPEEYFELEFNKYVKDFFSTSYAYDLYPVLGVVGRNPQQAARALYDMRDYPTEPLHNIVDRLCLKLHGLDLDYNSVQDGLLTACTGWPVGDERYAMMHATLMAAMDEVDGCTLSDAIRMVSDTHASKE